ncbi:unnamed protein product [Clonostachys rosea]|uniref:WH2 domain-containing protein n=1 Tax=Bionectria ochroleuca TaxID=29856 RepID=A0ABY6U8S2_BIOOC|nr:unnamed protein product [Clonostachys rosea]
MSKYTEKAKGKWNEHKPGQGKMRGQVVRTHSPLGLNTPLYGDIAKLSSNLVHRNKSSDSSSNDHVSVPLSHLKDPSSFAPPPRRTSSGLAPPPPPTKEKRQVVTSPSNYQDPRALNPAPPPRAGGGQHQEEEADAAPRGPYRVNTTGLATNHLPPPPGRRDGADGRSPPSYDTALTHPQQPPKPAQPSLPPRLPARTNVGTPPATPSGASNYGGDDGYLNQNAVNRLGAAGVSVPSLGIGRSTASSGPPLPPPRQDSSGSVNQINELQNRFSKMNSRNSPSPGPAASAPLPPPQRFGASPVQRANDSPSPGLPGKKKPPPPPPPKKKVGLGGGAEAALVPARAPAPPADDENAPPPIPLATKPRF